MDDLGIVRLVDAKNNVKNLKSIFKDNAALHGLNDKYSQAMVYPIDNIIVKALYYGINSCDNFDLEILQGIRDHKNGYRATYFLLSLLFLEKLDCVDSKYLAKEGKQVIQDIIKVQSANEIFG